MKHILALLLCFTALAQQTVNNFAVKTNLTVSGSAYLNNPALTNGTIFATVPNGFNQFPISGRGISGGINRTIQQYDYSIYQPTVTNRFVLDTSTSPTSTTTTPPWLTTTASGMRFGTRTPLPTRATLVRSTFNRPPPTSSTGPPRWMFSTTPPPRRILCPLLLLSGNGNRASSTWDRSCGAFG